MTPVHVAIPAPPNARPPGFVDHAYERAFEIDAPREAVWRWLETPETFTESQVWPYRVEFLSDDPQVAPGFEVGGINIHHGPGLDLAATLTEIREGEYRDMHYFYGSHVLGLRFLRPTRLRFWVEDAPGGATRVRLRLDSYAHRRLARLWGLAQRIFWSRFPRWMRRSLGATRVEALPA